MFVLICCLLFRLLLLGGCSGFLKNMKINNIKPDIKIFTQLLEVIPSTLAAEKVSHLIYKKNSLVRLAFNKKSLLCL